MAAQAIGFIGLGLMGLPMAANLIDAGFGLKVYNRTADKALPLAAKGAALASTPIDAATPGGVVLTMLSDDAAVEALTTGANGLIKQLGPGGVHVSFSTISAATSRRLAQLHAEAGSVYLAAPVFGRPDAAAARRLWICVSGEKAAKERVTPILKALSQEIFDFGEDPGAANVVKLAGNFMIMAAIEAISEAAAMAEKNGVDGSAAIAMLTKTLMACPVYQNYARIIANRSFDPAGFRLLLGLKDIDLVVKTATEGRSPMPIASLVRDRFLSALAKGRQDLDWAAVSLNAREDAGLE